MRYFFIHRYIPMRYFSFVGIYLHITSLFSIKRKKNLIIPVQPIAKARRVFKMRGSRTSINGCQ